MGHSLHAPQLPHVGQAMPRTHAQNDEAYSTCLACTEAGIITIIIIIAITTIMIIILIPLIIINTFMPRSGTMRRTRHVRYSLCLDHLSGSASQVVQGMKISDITIIITNIITTIMIITTF